MYGSDLKKMKSKFFLAVLLLTPILVVTFSTLYFLMGMSPEGTKNNGVFFKSYFDLTKGIVSALKILCHSSTYYKISKSFKNFSSYHLSKIVIEAKKSYFSF